MAREIGVQEVVLVGEESVFGTAVAATHSIPTAGDQNLSSVAEYTVDEQARGNRANRSGSEVSLLKTEPSWSGDVFSESFGIILKAALGSISSAANGDASGLVYDHTITPLNSTALPSYTIRTLGAAVDDRQSTGNVLNELTIDFASDARAKYTVSYMGQKGEESTGSAAFDTDDSPFRANDATVKIAAVGGDLDAAGAAEVLSGSIVISNNVATHKFTNSDEHGAILGGNLQISGTLTLLWDAATFRDLHLAGTKQTMRIDLQNTGVTIGTAANPQLKMDLTQVALDEWNKDTSATDTVQQTVGFKAELNATMIEAILTNLTTSY